MKFPRIVGGIVSLVAICVIGKSDVYASDQEAKLIIVSEDLAPYNYPEEGEAKGVASEVVQAVLKRLEMEVPISFYPWARAYQLAQQRQNTIIYSIVRMKERENLFEWVGEVTRHNASFYKLKHNTGISTISALEDAKPYKVGVYLNDAIHMYLVRNGFTNLDVATDSRLNLKKLLSGRIDLIAMDDAAFSFQMQREDAQIDSFDRMLSIEEMSGSLYMAFSKGSDPALISKFRRALEEIKSEGLYDQIQRKYFPLG